jgi:hypothetical protein
MEPDLVFLPFEKKDSGLLLSTNPLDVPATGRPQPLCNYKGSLDAKIKRLGRERPRVFRSSWHEIGFIFSIAMLQISWSINNIQSLTQRLCQGLTPIRNILSQAL